MNKKIDPSQYVLPRTSLVLKVINHLLKENDVVQAEFSISVNETEMTKE